jgi:hypothetical protein
MWKLLFFIAQSTTTMGVILFTYYLLEGLKGNTESVDSEDNVTPQSLGKYVYRKIMSLPVDERPRQKPITRAEESGGGSLKYLPDDNKNDQCLLLQRDN